MRHPNAPLWLTLAPTAFCQSHLWVDCWNIWPTVFSSTLSANGTLLSLWQKALKNILFLKCISFDWFCYVLICCVWGVISEGSALVKVTEYWLVEINIGIVIPFLFVFLQTYNLGSSNNKCTHSTMFLTPHQPICLRFTTVLQWEYTVDCNTKTVCSPIWEM